MEFAAKIRKQSDSLIITIPNEIVKLTNLQEGAIRIFDLKNDTDGIEKVTTGKKYE